MTIGTPWLIHLLTSIQLAALCKELNPASHMSTCHPQSQDKSELLPYFHILVIPGGGHSIPPLEIVDDDKIIIALVQLIACASIETSPSLQLATVSTLHIVFPMLIQQWLSATVEPEVTDSDRFAEISKSVEHTMKLWPDHPHSDQPELLAEWGTRQLLLVATVIFSAVSNPQTYFVLDIVVEALCQGVSASSSQNGRGEVARIYGDVTPKLLHNACRVFDSYSHSLLRLFSIANTDGTLLARGGLAASGLPDLLRLVSKANYDYARTEQILADIKFLVQGDVQTPGWMQADYLEAFVVDPACFGEISNLGGRERYTTPVVSCIEDIINSIRQNQTNEDPRREVSPAAVPSMLQAVLLAVRHPIGEDIDRRQTFLSNVLELFENMHVGAQAEAQCCVTIDSIRQALTTAAESHEELKDLAAKFEKWRPDPDHWLLIGLSGYLDDDVERDLEKR